MKLSSKIIISICFILFACVTALLIYRQSEILQRQKAIETEFVKQKELVDGITRSSNEYATKKDIEKFIKDNGLNLKAIQDDMALLHAEIKAVNVIKITSTGKQGDNLPTDHTGPVNPNPQIPTVDCNGKIIPCPNADQYGYLKNRQDFKLTESFGNIQVPIGEVGFSAWKANPWNYDIKSRTYNVSSVVGTDENQRQYFYNKFSVTVDNKTYDIKIDSATTKQEYPMAKFYWWNPRIFLGLDAGLNLSNINGEFTPDINIGIMSYGKFKNQPDFSFLQLGIGFGVVSNKPQVIIMPAAYNIGKHIPLMNNMYLGPAMHFGINGDISLMGGVRVAL